MLLNNSSSTSSVSLLDCGAVCHLLLSCLKFTTVSLLMTIFSITNILLLLPLLISASCRELHRQQQRQQCTRRTSIQSHLFTYHVMLFELLGVFGWAACLCGLLTDYDPMKIVWLYVLAFTVPGQTSCHILTCLERYLAVRHPIIFRRLKEAKMIRIRHAVVCLIWLLSSFEISLLHLNEWISVILMLFNLLINLSFSSFCSISVLCALNGPERKRRVGKREQMDKSKLMAFYTVMVILAGLWLRYFGHMLISLVLFSVHIGIANQCTVAISGFWFGFPSSLIMPLLFVYRTRKRYKVQEQPPRKAGVD